MADGAEREKNSKPPEAARGGSSSMEGEGERREARAEAPPRLREFVERSPGRLLAEAALGGSAGALISSAVSGSGPSMDFIAAGAVAAPIALMLTPVRGPILHRAIRYGVALAVLLTLVVSFTGPGRERPVAELIIFGFLFLAGGTLAHGLLAATVDRSVNGPDGPR